MALLSCHPQQRKHVSLAHCCVWRVPYRSQSASQSDSCARLSRSTSDNATTERTSSKHYYQGMFWPTTLLETLSPWVRRVCTSAVVSWCSLRCSLLSSAEHTGGTFPSQLEHEKKQPKTNKQENQRSTHHKQRPELCFSILGMVKAQPRCIGSFVIALHKNYLTTATDLKSSSSHC